MGAFPQLHEQLLGYDKASHDEDEIAKDRFENLRFKVASDTVADKDAAGGDP